MTKDFYTERLSLMFALFASAIIFVSSLLVKKGASFIFVASLVVFCVILILGFAIFTIVIQGLSKQEAETYAGEKVVFYSAGQYEFTPKVKATDVIEPKQKGKKPKRDPLKELLAVLPLLETKEEEMKESEKSKTPKNIETLLQEAGLDAISDEHPLKDIINLIIQADPQQLAHLLKGEWLTHGE